MMEMHKPVKRLTVLFLFLISISTYAGKADTALVAIKGATLLDVRIGRQIANSAILIEKERIKEVGDASRIVIPTDARVIDARGKWVIPGLIDMQVHGSALKEVPLALYVANGVTAVRDLEATLLPCVSLAKRLNLANNWDRVCFIAAMYWMEVHRCGRRSASSSTRLRKQKAP
jgi:hypothetical protein